jgi:hypothetical protein
LNLERDLEIGLVDQQLLFVLVDPIGRSPKYDLDDGRVVRTPPDGAKGPVARPE